MLPRKARDFMPKDIVLVGGICSVFLIRRSYVKIHAFFYKEPTSRPSSKSSLFEDLKSANCSTKSSINSSLIFKCHKNSTETGKT